VSTAATGRPTALLRQDRVEGVLLREPVTPAPDTRIFEMTETGLGIAAHGNYCGPNYSAGRFQASTTDPNVPAVDQLDQMCLEHDSAYNTHGSDLLKADLNFAKKVGFSRKKGALFGLMVGLQGVGRAVGYYPRYNQLKIVGDASQHFFPIMKTARRKYGRSRKYTKRKRVVKRSKKYNKKTRRYRRKSTRGFRKRYSDKLSKATYRYENGGTLDDPNAVYVGHGTPANRVAEVFFMAMYKKLMTEHGIEFKNWTEPVMRKSATSDEYHIRLAWSFGPQDNQTWINTTSNVAHTMSWIDSSYNLYSNFEIDYKAAVGSIAGEHLVPVFERLELWKLLPTNPSRSLVASVQLKQMYVSFYQNSSLRIQNRTANGANTGVTDVNNTNPLEGFVYYGKQNLNYLNPVDRPDSVQPTTGAGTKFFRGFVPGRNNGVITLAAENTADYAGIARTYKEPPSAKIIGAKYAKKFVLHPGQIIIDDWKFKRRMHIEKFSQILTKMLTNETVQDMNFGYCRVLGMEKLVADRSESNSVTVGYEINYGMSISLSSYHVGAIPYREVV